MSKIYLLNSQNAHMPELEAYPRVLQYAHTVQRVDDYIGEYSDGIFWCFMGLYRHRNNAGFLIHDYRSLSTGRCAAFKDFLKGKINPKPNLRIFLNESLERMMAFDDEIPSFRLDMGIPDSLLKWGKKPTDHYDFRFGYIGEISKDRGVDRMLHAFLNSRFRAERFILIGRAEPDIVSRFSRHANLVFPGVMPQPELFELLRKVEFAVSVLPDRRPYRYQTATKLLEYAALGMKILANRCESMVHSVETYNINVKWTGDLVFSDALDLTAVESNEYFDASVLSWQSMMRNSGLLDFLERIQLAGR